MALLIIAISGVTIIPPLWCWIVDLNKAEMMLKVLVR